MKFDVALPLPVSYQRFMDDFMLLDQIYTFLCKVKGTYAHPLTVINSIVPGKRVSIETLLKLAMLIPDVINLSLPSLDKDVIDMASVDMFDLAARKRIIARMSSNKT